MSKVKEVLVKYGKLDAKELEKLEKKLAKEAEKEAKEQAKKDKKKQDLDAGEYDEKTLNKRKKDELIAIIQQLVAEQLE